MLKIDRGRALCVKATHAASLGILLLISTLGACGIGVRDEPESRAVQFLTNVHTGQSMNEDEWLTKEIRSASGFRGHGGLAAMVKQSTAYAERYGGLKSVDVVQSTRKGDVAEIQARVLFKKKPTALPGAPASETEDMVWTISTVKENGRWLLSF